MGGVVSLLGEAIRIRREELGLGQEDVAHALDVSQQAVSRWEKGMSLPRPTKIPQLADLLEVDSARLQRLAGYLPDGERSAVAAPWHDVYARVPELSRQELLLLMDRLWEELRSREGLGPTGIR